MSHSQLYPHDTPDDIGLFFTVLYLESIRCCRVICSAGRSAQGPQPFWRPARRSLAGILSLMEALSSCLPFPLLTPQTSLLHHFFRFSVSPIATKDRRVLLSVTDYEYSAINQASRRAALKMKSSSAKRFSLIIARHSLSRNDASEEIVPALRLMYVL